MKTVHFASIRKNLIFSSPIKLIASFPKNLILSPFINHIVCFVLCSVAFGATGGSDAGNGGGIAEKRLIFAYQNLDKMIGSCLLTTLCHLNEKEAALLKEIRSSLEAEKKNHAPMEFMSGTSQPDSFKIEGQVRVAKTGDSIGSKIYINTDLLYWTGEKGIVQSVDLPSAASILIHELGHHHGIKDHIFLDELGSKVQTFLLKQTTQSEIWNGDVQLTIIQNNIVTKDEDKKHLHDIDQVLIGYGDQLVNLTDNLLHAVHCPKNAQTLRGLRIYNLHAERGVKFDPTTKIVTVPLKAWYILSCENGEESDHGDIVISLALKRKEKTNAPEFFENQSHFTQESCQTNKQVCK